MKAGEYYLSSGTGVIRGKRVAEMRRLPQSKDKNSLRPPPRNPPSGCHGSNKDGERGWSRDCKWESTRSVLLSLTLKFFDSICSVLLFASSLLRFYECSISIFPHSPFVPSLFEFFSPAAQSVPKTQQWRTFGIWGFAVVENKSRRWNWQMWPLPSVF